MILFVVWRQLVLIVCNVLAILYLG